MKQITGNVYLIGLGPVNTFVIEDNDGLILVDTGVKNARDKIFAAIRKGGKSPEDITRIILTHSHPDHAGGAAAIKRSLNGVPVYAHAEDASLISKGVAGRLPHVLSPGLLNWVLFNIFIKNSPNEVEAFEVDHFINDKDTLPFAGGIDVIYTPGHSLGHVCLLVKNEGLMIAGDICSNMGGLGLSTVYEDRAQGIQSILKTASFDFDKALFGHGGPLIQQANKKMKEKFEKMV